MDIAAFHLAMKTRAASDTGTGGLFASAPLVGGFYPNRADAGAAYPYVVVNVGSWTSDNAFQKDIGKVLVRLSVFHEKEGGDDPDTLNTCSKVLKRLYGNWASASPTSAPSYGFHRHPLVIASGTWVSTPMEFVGTREMHEPRYWHFVQEYLLWLSQ